MTDTAAPTPTLPVAGSGAATEAEVTAQVLATLGGIVGEAYLEDLAVDGSTRFDADLELESIEIVQLAEELLARYGDRVDFVAWFAGMDIDQLIELTVGDLVAFIVASLRGEVG